MNFKRNDTGGFTLIELLIAIFIFSIVVSSVYGAYTATFTVINGSEQHLNESHKARAAIQRITEDLEAVVTGPGGYLAGEEYNYGGSRGDNLSFISSTHVLFRESDKQYGDTMVSYTTQADEEAETLRLMRSDAVVYPGNQTTTEESTKFLLCDGLKEVQFTYFDGDGNETTEWQEDTADQNSEEHSAPSLPVMVGIKLIFAGSEKGTTGGTYTTAVAISAIAGE